jgi:3-deoxy-D-manno-octulosonic-acid transferase
LSVFFYNIFLLLFRGGSSLLSLWNKKARLWTEGRKNIFDRIQTSFSNPDQKTIWFHCSSLGEFEQGRPVLENLRSLYPEYKILLTFFSPSGYELRKDYKGADAVFYLPMDGKKNARRFLDIINPDLAVFVKYDYWYYYLMECKKRKIPLLLISAIFRERQPFFKPYGHFHRDMLHCFTHLFVQDNASEFLLKKIGIQPVTVAGDTRFDRVVEIAQKFTPLPEIEKFCNNSRLLVAGSTWPADEKVIRDAISDSQGIKTILAPHEIHAEHLQQLKKIFPGSVSYSELQSGMRQPDDSNILVIDNIGMLSRLYHYADIAYIGGGFDAGIHNVLEAAVYGKPVIFGPRFEKFKEAVDLLTSNGGFCIHNSEELKKTLSHLENAAEYSRSCENAKLYVYQNRGATGKIVQYIQANRLLTN